MLWSFKYNGNGHHGYHNKNRAVKGLKDSIYKYTYIGLYIYIRSEKCLTLGHYNLFKSY